MSAQGKRHAAVVFVPLGACRRQQIVQRARSTVNQEGTCGTKMTGRIALRAYLYICSIEQGEDTSITKVFVIKFINKV